MRRGGGLTRGSGLVRRTALAPGGPLAHTPFPAGAAQLARTGLVRAVMKRRPADNHMTPAESAARFKLLLERSDGKCEGRTPWCVAPGGLLIGMPRAAVSIQHRKAQGDGGTSRTDVHDLHHLLILCGDGVRGCHGWVETKERARAWELGLWIYQVDDGTTVPLVVSPQLRVLLHPTEPRYVDHPDPAGVIDGTVYRTRT